jgi:hypothetical protein
MQVIINKNNYVEKSLHKSDVKVGDIYIGEKYINEPLIIMEVSDSSITVEYINQGLGYVIPVADDDIVNVLRFDLNSILSEL